MATPRKLVYGWVRDLPDFRDYRAVRHNNFLSIPLPDYFDLTSLMPPVYDQGQVGSCTANASGAALEYNMMKQKLPFFMPSRLFAYYNARMIEGTVASDAGAQIRDVIKALVDFGACPETEWPYIESKFADKPTDACYTDAKIHVVSSYLAVDQDMDSVRGAIADGEPVVFGISIYESFESDAVAASGIVPMPNTTESLQGGHAVLIVGYDDKTERFKVRNSWGPDWGDKGYFYLPYKYVMDKDLSSDFWIIRSVAA